MKKLKVFVLFLMAMTYFPSVNRSSAKNMCKSHLIDIFSEAENHSVVYTAKMNRLIEAISMTESGGQSRAVSRCGRYVGHLQISKSMVKACNRIVGYKKYSYNDRYSRSKSNSMFQEFQQHYNPELNIEFAIRLWNTGDLDCMSNKKSSNGYYKRVMRNYIMLESLSERDAA